MNPDLFLADVLSAPERLARTLDAYEASDGPLGELAARSFDPRLIWDTGASREEHHA